MTFFLFTYHTLLGQVKIAFIEIIKPDCSTLYLEPNFKYAHVAISIKEGGWLNAHPRHGVQYTETLEELDFPKIKFIIIDLPYKKAPQFQHIKHLIGKPYDQHFNWSNNEAFYCSELVAKLLRIKPQPMIFDPKLWPESYWHLNGLPGLSPSLLFKDITK